MGVFNEIVVGKLLLLFHRREDSFFFKDYFQIRTILIRPQEENLSFLNNELLSWEDKEKCMRWHGGVDSEDAALRIPQTWVHTSEQSLACWLVLGMLLNLFAS